MSVKYLDQELLNKLPTEIWLNIDRILENSLRYDKKQKIKKFLNINIVVPFSLYNRLWVSEHQDFYSTRNGKLRVKHIISYGYPWIRYSFFGEHFVYSLDGWGVNSEERLFNIAIHYHDLFEEG